ncbi:hypothetical protein HDU78_006237 [Chytriomyces hyalinus]|nr:hypothetical protein HDU78_006237 [Chytriomyces hyalinus]
MNISTQTNPQQRIIKKLVAGSTTIAMLLEKENKTPSIVQMMINQLSIDTFLRLAHTTTRVIHPPKEVVDQIIIKLAKKTLTILPIMNEILLAITRKTTILHITKPTNVMRTIITQILNHSQKDTACSHHHEDQNNQTATYPQKPTPIKQRDTPVTEITLATETYQEKTIREAVQFNGKFIQTETRKKEILLTEEIIPTDHIIIEAMIELLHPYAAHLRPDMMTSKIKDVIDIYPHKEMVVEIDIYRLTEMVQNRKHDNESPHRRVGRSRSNQGGRSNNGGNRSPAPHGAGGVTPEPYNGDSDGQRRQRFMSPQRDGRKRSDASPHARDKFASSPSNQHIKKSTPRATPEPRQIDSENERPHRVMSPHREYRDGATRSASQQGHGKNKTVRTTPRETPEPRRDHFDDERRPRFVSPHRNGSRDGRSGSAARGLSRERDPIPFSDDVGKMFGRRV